jgi:integrator complex subunit 11
LNARCLFFKIYIHPKSFGTGAGQDVGRSCILVSLGGKNIMFDCGMHMGYDDARRFPDFNFISKSGNFTNAIDCIIITHLYHCLPRPWPVRLCVVCTRY